MINMWKIQNAWAGSLSFSENLIIKTCKCKRKKKNLPNNLKLCNVHNIKNNEIVKNYF